MFMSIGLKRGTVALEEHKIEWEISAQNMIKTIKNILGDDAIDVQHIGSTAIKNICAKPIIDIAVGVKDFNDVFKHNTQLKENGIIYRREDHPGQHLYVCTDEENDVQTHYIHVVAFESNDWNNYINMRDYLNFNKKKALEYSKLKMQSADKYPNDRIAYTNSKNEIIEEILVSANGWRNALK